MSEEFYKLKDNHPTMKKVRKLEAYAEKLGLTISVGFNLQLFIYDEEYPGISYQYRDFEQHPYGYDVTSNFPLSSESKVIFEKNE